MLDDLPARLEAAPRRVDQRRELLAEGLSGLMVPRPMTRAPLTRREPRAASRFGCRASCVERDA